MKKFKQPPTITIANGYDRLKEMIENNSTWGDIAEAFNMSVGGVRKAAERLGLFVVRQQGRRAGSISKKTFDILKYIDRRLDDDVSQNDIADELGVSSQYVSQLINKYLQNSDRMGGMNDHKVRKCSAKANSSRW